jgi:hypothetical protein
MLEFDDNTVRHANFWAKMILYTQGAAIATRLIGKAQRMLVIFCSSREPLGQVSFAELEHLLSAHMTNPSAITEFFSTTVMPDRMWKPSDVLSASCTPWKNQTANHMFSTHSHDTNSEGWCTEIIGL